MDPDGRIALVTGASKGIGKAVSYALADAGSSLFLVARSQDALQQVADACAERGAPEAQAHVADLSTREGIASTIEQVKSAFGGYDILVNNAGLGEPKPMADVSDAEFDHDMAVNVRAPYLLTRDAVEVMRKRGGGQVVQIGSGLSYRGAGTWSLYCAGKFALRGFTEAVRWEVAEDNVKVGLVAPGFTETQFFDGWGPPDAFRLPISAEDVAHAVMAMVTQSEQSDMREITVRNRGSP